MKFYGILFSFYLFCICKCKSLNGKEYNFKKNDTIINKTVALLQITIYFYFICIFIKIMKMQIKNKKQQYIRHFI